MKILRIISFGFPGGGAETGAMEIDEELRKKGITVKVISSDARPQEKHFSDIEFKSINPNSVSKLFTHLANLHAYSAIRKAIKEYKPDVVQLDTMGEVSPFPLVLFKNIPTVMTVHGPEFFVPDSIIWGLNKIGFKSEARSKKNLNLIGKIYYFYFRFIQGTLYKLLLPNVDLFVVNSKYMHDSIKDQLKPNMLIDNGIKLLSYKKISYNHNLLYVGRLEKYKGVEYMLKAMPKILDVYPDTKLKIVGEGPYKNSLLNIVKKLNIEKNVEFSGWIDHDEIEHSYQNCSIFIMPSVWPEAFGKTGVEAMSMGRPVIASRVGGIPEWLEQNKTGFLVEPKNAEQIAEKVLLLFKNKELLLRFSVNARKRAEDFSIEKYANRLEETYKKVIQASKYA